MLAHIKKVKAIALTGSGNHNSTDCVCPAPLEKKLPRDKQA